MPRGPLPAGTYSVRIVNATADGTGEVGGRHTHLCGAPDAGQFANPQHWTQASPGIEGQPEEGELEGELFGLSLYQGVAAGAE